MATFEKIDRANILFEKSDIRSYSLSGGTYSASIDMTTADGKTVTLKFDNNDDLRMFMETLMTMGLNMDWSLNYPSRYANASDGRYTLEDVKQWKDAYYMAEGIDATTDLKTD